MLDYLINNARILDPEAGSEFTGSLGIAKDQIAGLYPGGKGTPESVRKIDARGGLLIPGLIDVHAHTDNDIPCAEKLLAQGVTTVLSGNCGLSPVQLGAFFEHHREQGFPLHQAEQIGHTALREAVGLKDVYESADDKQINRMKELAGEAFREGAYGLSFGLEYVPGASNRELVQLAQTAADAGRLVSIHTRIEGLKDLSPIEEALSLNTQTGARVIVSHLVYMFIGEELIRAIETIRQYRHEGADIWVDSGMYTTYATHVNTPVFEESHFSSGVMKFDKIIAATGKYAGRRMTYDTYRDMRQNFPHDIFLYELGSAEDLDLAYSLEDVMISSDAGPSPDGQGHPQNAATFPFFFRKMVKEKKLFSLAEGVRRCTLLPAEALGLGSKGRLKPGADADIAVFDFERLRERADFPGIGIPDAAPEGVTHVFVAGEPAILNGQRQTGVMAGLPVYPGEKQGSTR